MNTNSRLLEIINTIRSQKGNTPLISIADNDLLRENMGFDSFDLAELTVRIEDDFGVDVFEDGIVSSVGEILSLITKD